MTNYQPGEIVNVTIQGAKVVSDDGFTLQITYELTGGGLTGAVLIPSDGAGITVERAAPGVSTGELWRDRNNYLWFVRGDMNGESAPLVSAPMMVPANGGVYGMPELTPSEVAREYGPLVRVYPESTGAA